MDALKHTSRAKQQVVGGLAATTRSFKRGVQRTTVTLVAIYMSASSCRVSIRVADLNRVVVPQVLSTSLLLYTNRLLSDST